MPDEQTRLVSRGRRYAETVDRLSAAFVRELRRALKASERQLAQLVIEARENARGAAVKAQRAILLRRQIREILRANGYDAVIATATQRAAEDLVAQALSGRDLARIEAFQLNGQQAVEALRQLKALDLLDQGDAAATALWRAITQQVFGTATTAEIVAELARVLDRSEAQARTLFDTLISIYTREVEDIATGELGPDQPFLFSGPVDNDIRPFCLEQVGKVLTRAEIDALDNGQLPNVFLTGGGYNCRHTWLAVESDDLRALVGTGRRMPPYDEDVARVTKLRGGG